MIRTLLALASVSLLFTSSALAQDAPRQADEEAALIEEGSEEDGEGANEERADNNGGGGITISDADVDMPETLGEILTVD